MQITTINLRQADQHLTQISRYQGDKEAKASILILHGMAEHHTRYETFANYLVQNGYDVYLYDHRGHGLSATKETLGFFADHNGYEKVVTDAIHVIKTLKDSAPKNKPFFLMGHSMGSIITRNVIQQYDDLSGVIICGTANPKRIVTFLGHIVVHMFGYKKKLREPAPKIDHLMFGGKLYKDLNKNTNFDWLSRDSKEVQKYIDDPYCGFLCTNSFYHDLLCLTKNATTPKNITKTNHSLPIFIISGTSDPVGSYGKDITSLIKFYKKNGYQNITSHLYEDARHELLNETNKSEVMRDIKQFLDHQLS